MLYEKKTFSLGPLLQLQFCDIIYSFMSVRVGCQMVRTFWMLASRDCRVMGSLIRMIIRMHARAIGAAGIPRAYDVPDYRSFADLLLCFTLARWNIGATKAHRTRSEPVSMRWQQYLHLLSSTAARRYYSRLTLNTRPLWSGYSRSSSSSR